jgi:hypothetical protein
MGKYREILLHAGLSKTGSTSIQDNCSEQRALLASHDVIYPGFTADDHVFRNHSIPLTVAISAAPGAYGLGLKRRFGRRVETITQQCRQQLEELVTAGNGGVLVLSTELVESWRDDDLQSLRAYFMPHARRLRVLAYLRSPESALASLVQERAKAGVMLCPSRLVGRVKAKVERLQRNFPAELELVSYHEAQGHCAGLVGAFMARAGVPDAVIRPLAFRHSNQRLSMEAYRLLERINRDFQPGHQAEHGVPRRPHDLAMLAEIPGQPFQLAGFEGSELQRQVLAESHWLESELGWRFPHVPPAEPAPAWQAPTIAALERALAAVREVPLRRSIAGLLREESGVLACAGRPEAELLRRLAARIEYAGTELSGNE